jgi:hypothetical protein
VVTVWRCVGARRSWSSLLPVLLILAFAAPARAQDESSPPYEPPAPHGMYWEMPAVDMPYTFAGGGAFPSMEQSLWVTTDFYQAMHFSIGAWLDPPSDSQRERYPIAAKFLIAGLDILGEAVPLAFAWQHEEWHRAVLGHYGMHSFNDVYNLNLFAESIAVSHVSDEDLIRLKAQHPADQVRLSTAGIEGNTQLAVNIERTAFFHDTRTWDPVILWMLAFGNSFYMKTCASHDSDTETAKAEAQEGASIEKRDFTGMDCNGWTYDLFHPDEPYAARGVHPSGVGIDRYRTYSQQSPSEQKYLRQQTWLSLLNFADPALIGFRRFVVESPFNEKPMAFNVALRHLPTAFGYDMRADVLAQQGQTNVAIAVHAYFNHQRYFPGLEAELLRRPFGRLLASSRLSLWLQPEAQRFESTSSRPGALASLRATWAGWRAIQPYVEMEAKTAGWVAGNVYLDRNVAGRVGLSGRLF